MTTTQSIINIDPEILGGTPVFRGTRVPVKTFFDYLAGGHPLSDFLLDFPSVSEEQCRALIKLARELVTPDACLAR